MNTSKAAFLSQAFLAAGLLATAPASANLILNGSFEAPPVPVGFYTNFPGGSSAITGWQVVGVDSAVVSGTFAQSGIAFQAQDGAQFIDLAGVNSNSKASGVTQSVATVIGQLYELSFHVGSATDGVFFFPTTVDLSIDGGARTSYSNPAAPTDMLDWKEFVLQFAATGALTSLTFFNGAAPNNYNTAFDNVSLAAVGSVPEPGAVWLLGLGLVGLRLGRRRRCL